MKLKFLKSRNLVEYYFASLSDIKFELHKILSVLISDFRIIEYKLNYVYLNLKNRNYPMTFIIKYIRNYK